MKRSTKIKKKGKPAKAARSSGVSNGILLDEKSREVQKELNLTWPSKGELEPIKFKSTATNQIGGGLSWFRVIGDGSIVAFRNETLIGYTTQLTPNVESWFTSTKNWGENPPLKFNSTHFHSRASAMHHITTVWLDHLKNLNLVPDPFY